MAEGLYNHYTNGKKKDSGVDRSKTREAAKAKADTDGALTPQQKFKVLELEAKIRDKKTEKAYVVGRNGQITAETNKGDSRHAYFDPDELKKATGGVLVHNHPGASLPQDTLGKRIGGAFSHQDLALGLVHGLTGVCAVTGNYTYNLNFNGRRANYKDVAADMSAALKKHRDSLRNYVYSSKSDRDFEERGARAHIIAVHRTNKEIADKYGFTYTRRRSR